VNIKTFFKRPERLPMDIHTGNPTLSPLEEWLSKNVMYISKILRRKNVRR